jgi:hypothetical protein
LRRRSRALQRSRKPVSVDALYVAACWADIERSVGRQRDSYGNARTESIMGRLKVEVIGHSSLLMHARSDAPIRRDVAVENCELLSMSLTGANGSA